MNQIEKILIPGIYKGQATHEPSKKNPNGLSSSIKMKIEKNKGFETCLRMISTYTTYDSKKKIHTVTRKSNIYKDHLGQYVYEAKDYVGKKIVSSQYGIISDINKKSNTLKIKIMYHYRFQKNIVYNNSIIKFKRNMDNKTLEGFFRSHKTLEGFFHFTKVLLTQQEE